MSELLDIVLCLVYHALYLAVAAEGNPSYAVFRAFVFVVAFRVAPRRGLAAQAAVPVGIGGEEAELIVEKDVELVDANAEELREDEMSAFVEEDEDGDGQDEL